MKLSEKRFGELKEKFRPELVEEPYVWMVKEPYGDEVDSTMRRLDFLAASSIRHWGTDWSKYDRPTARKRLEAGLSFVFMPRYTGCYLSWPDAVKPEFPGKNEYDPGEMARLWNYYQKNRPDGLRFFLVSCGKITEGEEVCRSWMESEAARPNDVIYGYPRQAGYTLIYSVKDGLFVAAKDYERDIGEYDPRKSEAFESLPAAKNFIYQKDFEAGRNVTA